MKRRNFIILTGLGATSATLLSACGHPENKLIPALIPDDEYVPGMDYWKASTCAMCEAGCGILVRTREHKANKIEGNPLHPVNRGALCARGQAGLQMLYNPDRITSPLKRTGERGSGRFEKITWEEAVKTLSARLSEIKAEGRQGAAAFLTKAPAGVTSHVASRFMKAYGSRSITCRSESHEPSSTTRIYDIANATYLLSFGARFLETWHSPVMYSLAYGDFRRAPGRTRGKLIQVEPRMSLTGANADEWLPARPGTERLIALSIAQVILREGLGKSAASNLPPGAIENYAPEKIAAITDIPAETVIRIARQFAASERPLAIGAAGAADGADILNAVAGNQDKKGGVLSARTDSFDPLQTLTPAGERQAEMKMSELSRMLSAESFSALLIHQVNPLYFAPSVRDRISQVPLIASFSSFMDETTEMADLVLPDHTSLERWDIQAVRPLQNGVAATITRPVVKPEFDTRQTADVLIALSRELGPEAASALPFASAEEVVRQAVASLPRPKQEQEEAAEEELAEEIDAAEESGGEEPGEEEEPVEEESDPVWEKLMETGVWTGEPESEAKAGTNAASVAPVTAPPIPASDEALSYDPQKEASSEFPLSLVTYESATFGDGSFANLPLLQELPDPMTTVMWGSWVEINPKTAASLGIAEGDLLEVETPNGSLRAPAVLYPAIRPDVVAVPSGQGHTAHGRYARGRGANAAVLNPQGELKGVRARVSRVPGEARLVKFGTSMPEHLHTKR